MSWPPRRTWWAMACVPIVSWLCAAAAAAQVPSPSRPTPPAGRIPTPAERVLPGTELLPPAQFESQPHDLVPPPPEDPPGEPESLTRPTPDPRLWHESHHPGHDPEAWQRLQPFRERAEQYPERQLLTVPPGLDNNLPSVGSPWWDSLVARPIRPPAQPLAVNLDNLVMGALLHSPQVLALAAESDSRQTAVAEELGTFDWRAFIDSTYDDTSDPVGNLLTTGGAPRFRDNHYLADYGLRRLNQFGGEFEAAQQFGLQDNNSNFFVPRQQGAARLELSYTQPLLNGAGRGFNQSRIVLAQISADAARDKLRDQLQLHLIKVTESYWEFYRARALHLQKRQLLDSASTIARMLEARAHVDAVQQQVLRAKAAVASRRSEIIRAETSIRNNESRLRLLVNDPELTATPHLELLPEEKPRSQYVPVSMRACLQTALRNRPDIAKAIRDIHASAVQMGIAEHELLPKLDLALSVQVAGLEGNYRVRSAFSEQFNEGEPGYSIGLLLEVPLGNRSAQARWERRQLLWRKAVLDFQATVEAAMTEVELAVREVETSFQELRSEFQAMQAATHETEFLQDRWRRVPDYDGDTTDLLEDLLDAQQRQADEEAGFVTAQVNHAQALSRLKQALGTLLKM